MRMVSLSLDRRRGPKVTDGFPPSIASSVAPEWPPYALRGRPASDLSGPTG